MRNPLEGIITFLEGLGKTVAAADSIVEHTRAVIDKTGARKVERNIHAGIELSVSTTPEGRVMLACGERFRIYLTSEKARKLANKLLAHADYSETTCPVCGAKPGEKCDAGLHS